MNVDTERLATEVAHYAHGRVPRDLRRRQVLNEAEQLFIERGYDGTSMDEVASRVGVSKPVVYDLVGSKEQLFHEVMTITADELSSCIALAVAAEPDLRKRLDAGALAFFSFVIGHRAAWDAILSGDAAPVTTAVAQIRNRQAELVVSLLTDGAAQLQLQVDPVQTEALGHAITGAFEALASWSQGHPELSPADLTALLTILVGPGLAALRGER